MRKPKIYYFAKDQLPYYADTKEPSLYPNLFEEMVKKSEYDHLVRKLKSTQDMLDAANEIIGKGAMQQMGLTHD